MGSLPTNTLVRSVAVDPIQPKRVYVAGPAGLFRSDDAGLSWTAADGVIGEPVAVTLDPAEPQRVFVVLADGSVWQSSDGAMTWRPSETGG